MKYLIVYEKSNTGWGAYAPDLPGLGAAGETLDEVKKLIREAVEFHVEGMRAHGDPIPAPQSLLLQKLALDPISQNWDNARTRAAFIDAFQFARTFPSGAKARVVIGSDRHG